MEQRYSRTISFNLALDEGGWSAPRPGRFIPTERREVQLVQEVVWAKEPPGVIRGTVEPVASRFTDCVIAAHEIEMI